MSINIISFLRSSRNLFLKRLFHFSAWWIYQKNRFHQTQLKDSLYTSEYKKYINCLKKGNNVKQQYRQLKEFLSSSFKLISDNLIQTDDVFVPIVFVVVRNELERMKIFLEHYRKLGIKNFIILDNGSDDGTVEYLEKQEGTKIYQILEKFQTQKKESWIEKMLAMEGVNRWCLVVDSDELLDFIGSENHLINQIIQKASEAGYKRIWGFMLDMYSKDPLFTQNNFNLSMIENLRFFDKNSYELFCVKGKNKNDLIFGGPRARAFNIKPALSKQAIFFYEENVLYSNCHFLFPTVKWGEIPCWFVLRHYKFSPADKMEYERRILEKGFYNNSQEYRIIMDKVKRQNDGMYYEDSVEYKDSNSLKCLPFITEISW